LASYIMASVGGWRKKMHTGLHPNFSDTESDRRCGTEWGWLAS